jgi:hypothetical protein
MEDNMSGGFNPVSLVSQAALATMTGGTSLIVSQLAKQLVSSIAQQVIQDIGQKLGLPQPMIDLAQGAAATQFGDAAGATQNYQEALQGIQDLFPGASPSDVGALQGAADDTYSSATDLALNMIRNLQDGQGQDAEGNAKGSGKASGGSWLLAIAKGLGKMLSEQAKQLEDKMNSTDWKDPGESAEFQAQSQEFGIAMNSATNAIKSIGEALSTMARKN